jgi:hypothetical protein
MDTLCKLHTLLGLVRWIVTVSVLFASGAIATDERETGPTGNGGSEATLACSVHDTAPGAVSFAGGDDLRIESSVTVASDGRQLVSSVKVSRHDGSYNTTVTLEVAVSGGKRP